MADAPINRPTARAKLAARRNPYFRQLEDRGYLGFRKMEDETWIARWRSDTGYKFKALGRVAEKDFDAAKFAAEEWFKSCKLGIVRTGTVEEACRAYADNIAKEKGDQAKKFAEWQLKPHVYDTDFGRTPLDRLTPAKVETWRNGLAEGRAKNSANRIVRTFKAAMNYAYRRGMVSSDRAWRVVQQFKEGDGQRTVYLDAAQRAALLAKCGPELAALVKGLFYTAARPTELTAAKVADLDETTGTLRLTTHKGRGEARARSVPLTPDALALFRSLKKDKLPGAYLFTKTGGTPWTRHQYGAELRKAVADAEVKHEGTRKKSKLPTDTVAYSMRHTAISEWLQAGIDIATVAKLAGTSVAMIDKNYHKFIRTSVEDKLATVKVV